MKLVFAIFALLCCQASASLEERIIGGIPAEPADYPFFVSLWRTLNGAGTAPTVYPRLCGGFILNERWIATAAHCVENYQREETANGLRSDIKVKFNDGSYGDIGAYYMHPDYFVEYIDGEDVETEISNDIALFYLTEDIEFSNYKQPATLPERVTAELESGVILRTIGFGDRSFPANEDIEQKFQEVDVPYITTADCIDLMKDTPLFISREFLCAGLLEGGKDSCFGDSGGPIFLPGTQEVVGIVTTGVGCALPALPGIYTRLDRQLGWVYFTMQYHEMVSQEPPAPCEETSPSTMINFNFAGMIPKL